MAAHPFHVHFNVVFRNFYSSFKILYDYIQNIVVGTGLEPATSRLCYASTTLGYPPLPHYELFDFRSTSVKSLNLKRSHIDIRAFNNHLIRDNLVSSKLVSG